MLPGETERKVEGHVKHNQAYTLALAAAMDEFDELEPEFKKLNNRILALRSTMRGLAMLLDEELEDRYRFNQFRSDYGSRPTSVVKTRRK